MLTIELHTIQKHIEAQDNQVLFSASRWTHPAWRPSDPSPLWLRPRCQGTCYTESSVTSGSRKRGGGFGNRRQTRTSAVCRARHQQVSGKHGNQRLRRWEDKEVSFTQSWAVVMDAQLGLALWLSRDIPMEASAPHTQV